MIRFRLFILSESFLPAINYHKHVAIRKKNIVRQSDIVPNCFMIPGTGVFCMHSFTLLFYFGVENRIKSEKIESTIIK